MMCFYQTYTESPSSQPKPTQGEGTGDARQVQWHGHGAGGAEPWRGHGRRHAAHPMPLRSAADRREGGHVRLGTAPTAQGSSYRSGGSQPLGFAITADHWEGGHVRLGTAPTAK